ICTAVLALVVFAVTDNKNSAAPAPYLAPLVCGLTVAALISIIAPLTQCCLNPARDFGPRLFTYFAGWGAAAMPGPNGWQGVIGVYIIAPSISAIAGGGIYDHLLGTNFRSQSSVRNDIEGVPERNLNLETLLPTFVIPSLHHA